MVARLLVSVSGVGGPALAAAEQFAAELDHRSVPLSLLVTPKRQLRQPAIADWLGSRADRGDALVLHGVNQVGQRAVPGWRGAEFAVLPAHEAGLKLFAARTALAQLGLGTDCFAPPGWVASPGTLSALRRNGFNVCAELRGVRGLALDTVVPGRVLNPFPAIRRAEPWWCLALVLGAARAARRDRLVRLAVHAEDLHRPGVRQAMLDSVDIALHHGARPTTYPDLFAPPTLPVQRTAQTSVSSPAGGAVTVVPFGASRSNIP